MFYTAHSLCHKRISLFATEATDISSDDVGSGRGRQRDDRLEAALGHREDQVGAQLHAQSAVRGTHAGRDGT